MNQGDGLVKKVFRPHVLLILLVIGLIFLVFIGSYSITGLLFYDGFTFVNQTFNTSVNLSIDAPLVFGLNGKILGGTARIYLANDSILDMSEKSNFSEHAQESLILDSSLLTNSTFSDYCLGNCSGGLISLRIEIINGSLYLEGLNDRDYNAVPYWDSSLEEFVVGVGGALVVDLDDYFMDFEEDELTYLVTSSSLFNITVVDSIMTVIPLTNSSVSENITIVVSDMRNTLRFDVMIRSDNIDLIRQEVLNSPVILEEEVVSGLEIGEEVTVLIPTIEKDLGLVEKPVGEFVVGEVYDYSSVKNYTKLNMMSLKVTRSGLEKLKKNKKISGIYADKELTINLNEGLQLVNAVQAAAISGGDVGVCLLDTGVNGGNLSGWNFVSDNNDVSDDNGHGTVVASILKEVAPSVEIIPVKVCDATGSCLSSDVLEGLNYCLDEKVRRNISVVSGSFGDKGEYTSESCPSYYGDTFDILDKALISSVFASGNDGYRNGINFPACDINVIEVGSSDKQDGIALFSNLVPGLLLAPGEDLNVSGVVVSGTSYSVPFVTGGVAMLKEVNESLNTQTIKTTFLNTGKKIGNYTRVDLAAALKNIGPPVTEVDRYCTAENDCLIQSEKDLLYPCHIEENVIVCNELSEEEQKTYRRSLDSDERKIYFKDGIPLVNHLGSSLSITSYDPENRTVVFNVTINSTNTINTTNSTNTTQEAALYPRTTITTQQQTLYLNPELKYLIKIDLMKPIRLEIGFDSGGGE